MTPEEDDGSVRQEAVQAGPDNTVAAEVRAVAGVAEVAMGAGWAAELATAAAAAAVISRSLTPPLTAIRSARPKRGPIRPATRSHSHS